MRCGHYRGGTAPILKLPDPAHFHEVAFEVEELRVGFAHLVGKRDLGAEPVHRDRAVQQRSLQDPDLVCAGGIIGARTEPTGPRNPSTGNRR